MLLSHPRSMMFRSDWEIAVQRPLLCRRMMFPGSVLKLSRSLAQSSCRISCQRFNVLSRVSTIAETKVPGAITACQSKDLLSLSPDDPSRGGLRGSVPNTADADWFDSFCRLLREFRMNHGRSLWFKLCSLIMGILLVIGVFTLACVMIFRRDPNVCSGGDEPFPWRSFCPFLIRPCSVVQKIKAKQILLSPFLRRPVVFHDFLLYYDSISGKCACHLVSILAQDA